jgi:hypothetical protein
MSSDSDNIQILMEDVQAKFDAIMEVVLPSRKDIEQLKLDMNEVKADVKVIKAAVIDNSSQINDNERRTTQLEAA